MSECWGEEVMSGAMYAVAAQGAVSRSTQTAVEAVGSEAGASAGWEGTKSLYLAMTNTTL